MSSYEESKHMKRQVQRLVHKVSVFAPFVSYKHTMIRLDKIEAYIDEILDVPWFCVLCTAPGKGFGNNPAPLALEGLCCDACNIKVIAARKKARESS